MLPKLINNHFPTIHNFFDHNNRLIGGSVDWLDGVELWLSMQTRSESTHRSYTREAERFLLWCSYINNKAFNDLRIEDVKRYSEFICNVEELNPKWCGARTRRSDSSWRPFVGNLSAVSHDTSLAILQSLFEWLVSDGRVSKNPFKLLVNSRLQKKKQLDTANAFTKVEISKILSLIEVCNPTTTEQGRLLIRDKWIFTLMVMTGLRCSEVANTKFSSITKVDDSWYLNITGKGNKNRVIPLSSSVLMLMKEYRSYFGLAPYPSPGDNRYLVFSVRGFTQLTNKALYNSIKSVFFRISDYITDPYLKSRLKIASPHWLRGTFATLINDKTDNATLQNLMGHSSFDTTLRYIYISNNKASQAINSIDL
jgi:site-specific recombinase XerD